MRSSPDDGAVLRCGSVQLILWRQPLLIGGMFCNRCGHYNQPCVTFCAVCGAVLYVVDPTGSLPILGNDGPPASTDADSPIDGIPVRTVERCAGGARR